MFSSFMVNAWIAGTFVAVLGGVVGFYVVLGGNTFAAHALPTSAFAGAGAAAIAGVDPLVGLLAFSLLGAVGIASLENRASQGVPTALITTFILGVGSLFLSITNSYGEQIFAVLFGQVLGISRGELWAIGGTSIVCVGAVGLMSRPITISVLLPASAEAAGLNQGRMKLALLAAVALATSIALPVVGALLIFTLLVSPAASARYLVSSLRGGVVASVMIAVITVWLSIGLAYLTNLPVGFFVGTFGVLGYVGARTLSKVTSR